MTDGPSQALGQQKHDRAQGLPRVAFIGGIPRSGSTLLELLLAQGGDFCSVGETVHLWQRGILDDERCACGERFAQCSFWSPVGQRAFGGWDPELASRVLALQRSVDRARFVPLTVAADHREGRASRIARYGEHYRRLYRAALEESGAVTVLDSSKHVSLAAVLAMTEGIDLRIVHLVRAPQAVAHSWSRVVVRPEAGGEALMPQASSLRISGRWVAQNALFSLVAARAPVLRVLYEDLVQDPGTVVGHVRDFLGMPLPTTGAAHRSAPTGSPVHSVAGNPIRFNAGPIRVAADEAWRSDMDRWDRRMVTAVTAPLAWKYGLFP